MKLTGGMLPVIRSVAGLTQAEFSLYAGIPQARLSDIETGKIPVSDHYLDKAFLAIGKLKITEKELDQIYKLTENQK